MKLLPANIPSAVASAALAVLLSVPAQAQPVMFFDGEFNPADWTATLILDTTPQGAIATAQQQLQGGNPGAFWRTTHRFNGLGGMAVAHTLAGAAYDPGTQGPIGSIDYSWDLNHINSPGAAQVAYRLLVLQNGLFYNTTNDLGVLPNWTPFARKGLRAADFFRIVGDGPLHPDFSHRGAPIQLGFITANSSPSPAGSVFRDHGIDNWKVQIIPGDPVITTMPPLPNGMIETAYQTQLAVIGGVPPYTWKIISGILPPRLMLDGATGAIGGTPDRPGVFEWAVLVSDSAGASSAKKFRIRVDGPPLAEPSLGNEPNRLLFSFVGQSAPRTRRLRVANEGGGALDLEVETSTESGGPWLSVTTLAGSVMAAQPQAIEVTADPTGLAAGTYFGEIRLGRVGKGGPPPPGGPPQGGPEAGPGAVRVTMAISERRQLLRVSQRGLTYSAIEGAPAGPPRRFRVSNRGFGVMAWRTQVSTAAGGDWLTATPESGNSDGAQASPVLVRVDPTGLPAGSYYGVVEVTAPGAANSPRIVTVVLNLESAARGARLAVQPVGLIFVARPGEDAPPAQQVRLSNVSVDGITFTGQVSTLTGDGWLSATDATNSAGVVQPGVPAVLNVEVDPAGLDAGIYKGLLLLSLADGPSRAVDVVLVVADDAAPAAKAAADAAELTVTGPSGAGCVRTELAPVLSLLGGTLTVPASWPTSVEVSVVDNCGAQMEQGSVVLDFTNVSSPSLALGHAGDGLWSGTWNTPDVTAAAMAGVTVTASDLGGISGVLSQSLTVEPNDAAVPKVNTGGVVHSANFVQDPLAPGTIIALFGENLSSEPVAGGALADALPLPTELAGTQITLGGQELPLLFSREDQVNAILPFELEDRVNEGLSFLLRRTDLGSVAISEPLFITDARPGVFTQNASGTGPGSIQDLGFQLVTAANPVSAGDVIIIYCAGLGEVTPDVATGEASTVVPLITTDAAPTVTVGGLPAAVGFSGLTPGFASLYQINATVPAGVAAGEVEVVISISGQPSTSVTLFVQ